MKKFVVLVVALVMTIGMASVVFARAASPIQVTSAHGFKYLWDNAGGMVPQYMGNMTWLFSSDHNSDIGGDVEMFFKIYPCLEIEKILYSDEKMMIIKVMGTM